MRRRGLLLSLVLVLGAVAGLLLATQEIAAGGSALSRGGSGWLAARLYLAKRGATSELVDRPLAAVADGRGTMVIVFPWQSRNTEVDDQAVFAHLGHGGDVLIAYGPEPTPSGAEKAILDTVGIDTEPVPSPTLVPWRWRSESRKGWRLHPAPRWPSAPARASDGEASSLTLRRPRWLPTLAKESALLLGPGDGVVAAAFPLRKGRVIVMPAELLCNARLASAAHGALLETLRGWLAGPWRFDEYHHGLGGDGKEALPSATRRGFDLLFAQLVLIYAMAALALGRRLGPAWREAPPLVGSAGGFLLRLGSLHHELGHHREGATLLLKRAGELDRRLALDSRVSEVAERSDAAALVEVGQTVARSQRHS